MFINLKNLKKENSNFIIEADWVKELDDKEIMPVKISGKIYKNNFRFDLAWVEGDLAVEFQELDNYDQEQFKNDFAEYYFNNN